MSINFSQFIVRLSWSCFFLWLLALYNCRWSGTCTAMMWCLPMVMNFMRVAFAIFICLLFFSMKASCQNHQCVG